MGVGVLSGTYSSIFIATPVLTHWKEREPAYRARRGRLIEEMGYVPTLPEDNVVAKLGADGEPAPVPAAPAPVAAGAVPQPQAAKAGGPESGDGAESAVEKPREDPAPLAASAPGEPTPPAPGTPAEPAQPARPQGQPKRRQQRRRRKHGRNR
jgi:SecD/SecF fusion protein